MTSKSSIKRFYNGLKTDLNRADIILDLAVNFKVLKETVIPMLEQVKGLTITSDHHKVDVHVFNRISNADGSPAAKALNVAKSALSKEDELTKLVQDNFSEENHKTVMDYNQLAILRYLEGVAFFNDYTKKWTSDVIYRELEEADEKMSTPISRANRRWLARDTYVSSYVIVAKSLLAPLEDFIKPSQKLKGRVFDEDDHDALAASMGEGKLSPAKFNLIPVALNPFYHIALAVNAWRVERHNHNKETLSEQRISLLWLEEQRSTTPDKDKLTRLAKEIREVSNDINKLEAKINKMENPR